MKETMNWLDEPEYAFGSALADMDNDLGAFRELESIYSEELPGQLRKLRQGASRAEQLLPLLHEAANTLGVIGARLYSQNIRFMEEALRAGGPVAPEDAARSTADAMERSGIALALWLGSRRA
jgi:hypothetical protein